MGRTECRTCHKPRPGTGKLTLKGSTAIAAYLKLREAGKVLLFHGTASESETTSSSATRGETESAVEKRDSAPVTHWIAVKVTRGSGTTATIEWADSLEADTDRTELFDRLLLSLGLTRGS